MEMSSLAATQSIDISKLENLRSENNVTKDGLDEAAKQFESVFMSMILKQMRQTLDNGFFGKENSDSYGAMFDLYMGQHLSDQGGLGIRESLLQQYARNEKI